MGIVEECVNWAVFFVLSLRKIKTQNYLFLVARAVIFLFIFAT